jgi:hypothetical protein
MTSKTLTLGDAEFIFLFSFTPDEPLASPPAPSDPPAPPIGKPYLECLFYCKGFPNDYFHWTGTLTTGIKIAFELPGDGIASASPPYPAGAYCQGHFWLYTNSHTAESYVWFDFNYGPESEGEYEGAMVQFEKDKN